MTRRTVRCRSRWPGRADVVVPIAPGQTLYAALRAEDRPIASACTGDAVCGRCAVALLEGVDAVTPAGPDEARVLARQGADPGARLACLVSVVGDGVVVGTDYW